MEWQIRERGSNKILEQGETLVNLLAYEYSSPEHYICLKGEILVSEEWLKELNDLKDCHFRATVYAHDKLRISEEENAALKAELAELKAQKALAEAAEIMGDSRSKISFAVASSNILKDAGLSEPEKEVTRGEEVADLVARISWYTMQIEAAKTTNYGTNSDSYLALRELENKQQSAQDQLATLINQGV